MGLRARLRRLGANTAVRVGALGGLACSLAGLVGYVLVPVVTGAQPSVLEASMSAGIVGTAFSPADHAAILFVPPFASAFAGTLYLRWRGIDGLARDATVLVNVVLYPVLTVIVTGLVTIVVYAVTLPSEGTTVSRLGVTAAFLVWGLIFGGLLVVVLVAVVLVVGLLATLSGYACARLTWRALGGQAGRSVAESTDRRDS